MIISYLTNHKRPVILNFPFEYIKPTEVRSNRTELEKESLLF